MPGTMKIPNPYMTVSYQKLKDRNLLDPSFVKHVDTMPRPKCGGPVAPGGPAPKCIGWSVDGYVTRSPVVHLYGVSPKSAKELKKAGLGTIGDMLTTKSGFLTPNFSKTVRRILQRVKEGVQKSRVAG